MVSVQPKDWSLWALSSFHRGTAGCLAAADSQQQTVQWITHTHTHTHTHTVARSDVNRSRGVDTVIHTNHRPITVQQLSVESRRCIITVIVALVLEALTPLNVIYVPQYHIDMNIANLYMPFCWYYYRFFHRKYDRSLVTLNKVNLTVGNIYLMKLTLKYQWVISPHTNVYNSTTPEIDHEFFSEFVCFNIHLVTRMWCHFCVKALHHTSHKHRPAQSQQQTLR